MLTITEKQRELYSESLLFG